MKNIEGIDDPKTLLRSEGDETKSSMKSFFKYVLQKKASSPSLSTKPSQSYQTRSVHGKPAGIPKETKMTDDSPAGDLNCQQNLSCQMPKNMLNSRRYKSREPLVSIIDGPTGDTKLVHITSHNDVQNNRSYDRSIKSKYKDEEHYDANRRIRHTREESGNQEGNIRKNTNRKSIIDDKTASKRTSPLKRSSKVSFRNNSNRISHHRSVQSSKRISAVESPTKRLNKKLMQLVGELRRNCDFYRYELKRLKEQDLGEALQYQKENEILNQELYNMQLEADEWKKRCKRVENRNVAIVKLRSLENENRELKEDLEVFKSVICRLNKEMVFYQDKLNIPVGLNPVEGPMYSTSSASPDDKGSQYEERNENSLRDVSQWLRKPQKTLFPLLVAYDEAIKEKNDIIKNQEEVMERFKQRCKQVVRENEELHDLVAQRKEKGTVSIEEWQFLHANSLIVLEENDLLHEQISNLKRKDELIIKSHQDKASKLKSKISGLEQEKAQMKSAAIKTEKQCKLLVEQHSRLAEIIEKRVPVEQHEASVMECKKLFEELKISYGDERTVLMEKLVSAEKERDRLVDEIAGLEATNGRLQSNLKTCEEALAVNTAQFREAYSRIAEATKAKEASTSAMGEMMELSQRVVSERESTEQLLNDQRSLNEKLILLRQRECELVAELQGKIKAMEDVHETELEKLMLRIKELENIIHGMGGRHKEEMLHLEEMIKEKSKRLEHLETEKRQLQADLETVWKTTTCTVKDIATHKSTQNQETQ